MNAAKALLTTLLQAGVDACFSNPGTPEMHSVAALDRAPGMRSVLCLLEDVTTGAAGSYARMAQKPAATRLHFGPCLAKRLSKSATSRSTSSSIEQ